MNEERIGLWLRQTEHIRSQFWHSYSVTVIKVMVVTVKLVHIKPGTFLHNHKSANHSDAHVKYKLISIISLPNLVDKRIGCNGQFTWQLYIQPYLDDTYKEKNHDCHKSFYFPIGISSIDQKLEFHHSTGYLHDI